MTRRWACVTTILAAVTGAIAQPADLVIENARIWSDGIDPAEPVSFAAVRDGRFVHVGEPDAALIGRDTERVDADGRVVIPGLIDSHVHMLSGGQALGAIQLREATSKADFIRRVEDWTAGLDKGEWILGGRWSVESWEDPEQPTKEWLDGVTGDHPAFLSRMDGHSALANSRALEIAGITADGPPDPVGGVIDRDPETGEPTGILRESAMGLVSRHIPRESREAKRKALERAMAHANSFGVTSVCDIPGAGDIEVYRALAQQGPEALTTRFFLYPTPAPGTVVDWEPWSAADGRLRLRGFKAYMDGSLGSRTAYMHEPYLNNEPERPEWSGLLREGIEDGWFRREAARARDAGLQVIAHAIGDKANTKLLDILGSVDGSDLPAARARSEHAQHLRPEDIARFARTGVIASMQPYHKADDGRYCEEYIGEKRSESSYAFRSLLEAGAVVCFGSDWPVVSMSPWLGIDAAVNARTLDGRVWQPQESISVEEALKCYTSRAAYAAFAEDEIGRIAPGLRADCVVLSASPFDAGADLAAIEPVAVMVDGEFVLGP